MAITLRVGLQEGSLGFLSGGRASMNEVALAIRHVSLTPSAIIIILKLTNVNSRVRVCDIALDADAFAISDNTFWICPEDQFGATSGNTVGFVALR
jgi:hypothetical protein